MPRLWSNKHTLVKRLIRTKNRENCPFQDGISLLQNKTNWIPLIQSQLLQEKEKRMKKTKEGGIIWQILHPRPKVTLNQKKI